jgi:hypothetical protein
VKIKHRNWQLDQVFGALLLNISTVSSSASSNLMTANWQRIRPRGCQAATRCGPSLLRFADLAAGKLSLNVFVQRLAEGESPETKGWTKPLRGANRPGTLTMVS